MYGEGRAKLIKVKRPGLVGFEKQLASKCKSSVLTAFIG